MWRKQLMFLSLVLVSFLLSCTTINSTSLSTTQTTKSTMIGDISVSLLPGVDTIEIGSEWLDGGAVATYQAETFPMNVRKNEVDVTKVGTYRVEYEIQIGLQTVSILRLVTVKDETPPLLRLNPGIDTIMKGQTWEDAYVEVLDNSLGDVTVEVEGSINPEMSGEYQIKYIATDASGNSSSIIRIVTVIPA